MKDIYIVSSNYEQTVADKKPVNVIYIINVIHYVVSGQGYFNGKLLKKGQGFVCPKDVFCSYYPDKDDPWAYIWISLDGIDVTSHLQQYANSEYIFDFRCSPDFEQLSRLLLNPSLLSDTDYAMSAFNILYSHQADYEPRQLPQTGDIVWKAKEYILHNYYMDITIEDVARHLHVSRAYLRNVFYQREHMAPKNYLIQIRLSQAKQLLKAGLSVRETAASVGYEDMFQFSKIFKKHIGCSPSAYAKKI